MATKRFLRFFLSFVTTKQFYAGITTALICVGLSVFFCTMHNFIGISFMLFCTYITIHHNISPYFAKTSGKHMANRTSTADGSFFTIFTSPPM